MSARRHTHLDGDERELRGSAADKRVFRTRRGKARQGDICVLSTCGLAGRVCARIWTVTVAIESQSSRAGFSINLSGARYRDWR